MYMYLLKAQMEPEPPLTLLCPPTSDPAGSLALCPPETKKAPAPPASSKQRDSWGAGGGAGPVTPDRHTHLPRGSQTFKSPAGMEKCWSPEDPPELILGSLSPSWKVPVGLPGTRRLWCSRCDHNHNLGGGRPPATQTRLFLPVPCPGPSVPLLCRHAPFFSHRATVNRSFCVGTGWGWERRGWGRDQTQQLSE